MIEYNVKVYSNRIEWKHNGKLHRVGGPAFVYNNGTKYWYQDGKLHREDGPAIECANGAKRWYLRDKEYSKEQFEYEVSVAKEMTVADIEKMLGYKVKIVK